MWLDPGKTPAYHPHLTLHRECRVGTIFKG
jgi:hypothetical protein